MRPPKPAASLPALGRLLWRLHRDVLTTAAEAFQRRGDILFTDLLGYDVYLLVHPDHISEVLVRQAAKFHKPRGLKDPQRGLARFLGNGLLTSDGEFWKRQRRLVQPAFHLQRLEGYARVMTEYAQQTLAGWRDGETRDIDRELAALALRIVARTLFDADLTSQVERIGWALSVMQSMANSLNILPHTWPTPRNRRRARALETLDHIVYAFIDRWQADRPDRGDLLSMLMMAVDEQDESGMSHREVRDELVTMLLAGHETSGVALTWTCYLLSQHPAAEARLYRELDRVLGGRPPAPEDLGLLPYTEMVVKESMRLYPPVWYVYRQAMEELRIGDYTVPRGAEVVIVSCATHRDPRWYPDPHQFRPERFSPEEAERIPRYAYLPFGGGPRMCIGAPFAMLETRLLLPCLAQRFQMRVAPGQRIAPSPRLTLRPRYGMRMQLRARR